MNLSNVSTARLSSALRYSITLAALGTTLAACSGGAMPCSNGRCAILDDAPAADVANAHDAAVTPDASSETDARLEPDAASPDAGSSDTSTDSARPDACVPAATPDVPDRDGVDSDCDGIDGSVANSVFVAPGPSSGGTGSREDPFHRIGDGIAAARGSRRAVLVAAGSYAEQVTLSDGVLVAGGYDAGGWTRGAGETRVTGPCPVLVARFLDARTEVQRVAFVGDDATLTAESCIAAMLESSAGVVLVDVTLHAGRGAPGGTGSAGVDGASAEAGTFGRAGRTDAMMTPPPASGGGTGAQSCMGPGNGGWGGAGGTRSGREGASGAFASPPGGSGGSGGHSGGSGTDGREGLPGADGANGGSSASEVGALSASGYVPAAPGADGADGAIGSAGGGGGGGSYYLCSDDVTGFTGGGGGGGGGGGCGGRHGAGGSSGGASIAVAIVGGTPSFERVRFETAGGGDGGQGAPGGAGGAGGDGGEARGCTVALGIGTRPCSCIAGGPPVLNAGGRGARGREGGRGGAGGGGAGGPSLGIAQSNGGAAILTASPVFSIGPGGAGGMPGSTDATPGVQGRATRITTF